MPWTIPGDVMESSLKAVKRGAKFVNYKLNSDAATYLGDRLQEERDKLAAQQEAARNGRTPAQNGLRRLRNAALTKTSALTVPEEGPRKGRPLPKLPKLNLGASPMGLDCASNRRLAKYYGDLWGSMFQKGAEDEEPDREESGAVDIIVDAADEILSHRPAYRALKASLIEAGVLRKEALEFEPVDRSEGFEWYRAPKHLALSPFPFTSASEESRVKARVARAEREARFAGLKREREEKWRRLGDRVKARWNGDLGKEAAQTDALGKMNSPAAQGGHVDTPMPQTNYAKGTLENEYAERLTRRQSAELYQQRQQQAQNQQNQTQTTTTDQNGATAASTTSGLSNSGLMAALSIGSTM